MVETIAGTFYAVEINSSCVVGEQLEKIAGTSDHMTFWYGNTSDQPEYSWMFNGDTIPTDGSDLDFDPHITISTLGTDDVANIMSQVDNGIVLEFVHDGDLPAPAEIYVDVSEIYADGTTLSLYLFDETTRTFSKVQDDILVELKYASFELDHCSIWALSTDDLSAYTVVETNTPFAASTSAESPYMSDEDGGSGLSPALLAAVVIIVIAAIAAVVVLVVRSRRKKAAAESATTEELLDDAVSDVLTADEETGDGEALESASAETT